MSRPPVEAPASWLPEPRFDLSVVNAPAPQVFLAIASDTRYSMLLPPNLPGTITVNLKDVTVREAMESLRELYGYEYRIEGKRVFVQMASCGHALSGELPVKWLARAMGRPARGFRFAELVFPRPALPAAPCPAAAIPRVGAPAPRRGLAQCRGEPPGHHHQFGFLGNDERLAVGDR